MDLDERAERCRVMWVKARNMYTAFFAELSDVRETLSADEFDNWCYKSVGVSLTVAIKASEVLKASDATRVQSELKATARLAKEIHKKDLTKIRAERVAKQLEMEENLSKIRVQEAVTAQLVYISKDVRVFQLLNDLTVRRTATSIQNGLDYLRLQELVKSGAEGNDPDTGKKWKWEKWAQIAIGRPISTIRNAIADAKKDLSKNAEHSAKFDKALNGNDNPARYLTDPIEFHAS